VTIPENVILHTILVRPYVFLFLAAYLVLSISSWGWRRSFAFLLFGYLIAWASEAASIRTGFPYGWYFYRYENLEGEWLNAGVPVWDSLSYVFLCYAGLELAAVILRHKPKDLPSKRGRFFVPLRMTLLSALFVTLLDIVIDPVANMGERWFLGKIYDYPNPGFYFGVPLANFAGWFLVSFVIVGLNGTFACHCEPASGERSNPEGPARLLRRPRPPRNDHEIRSFINQYGGTLFYFAIFLFNWGITLALQEWLLAFLDCVWISIPVILLHRKRGLPTPG